MKRTGRAGKKASDARPEELPAQFVSLFETHRRRRGERGKQSRGKASVSSDDEPGQTFKEFLEDLEQFDDPKRPAGSTRNTIYLRPLGAFPPDASPRLAVLADLCRAFFLGMQVTVLAPFQFNSDDSGGTRAKRKVLVEVEDGVYDVRQRRAPDGTHLQLCLSDLGDVLLWKLPEDAWCVIGVTMRDMFESSEDVFCMGRAWGASRIGVFSFLRYDPAFPAGAGRDPDIEDRTDTLTYRAGKTLLHELGHCFGIDHCVEYDCLMNAATCMEEDLAAPYHACPLDLQKLRYSLQFAPGAQAAALHDVYARHPSAFGKEADFARRALMELGGDAALL